MSEEYWIQEGAHWSYSRPEEDKEILPPGALEEAKLSKIASTKYKCSWPSVATDGDTPSIAGYNIEIEFRHKADINWTLLNGIKTELIDGKYWIVRDDTYFENKGDKEFSTVTLSKDDECTFLGCAAAACIANFDGKNFTEAFFNPKTPDTVKNKNLKGLAFKKDHIYKFTIYPYVTYSSYWDESGQPQVGTGLAPDGTASKESKYTTGAMKVKTENGWREGLVYVMIIDGDGNKEWKEATGIYVNTAKGWKESV